MKKQTKILLAIAAIAIAAALVYMNYPMMTGSFGDTISTQLTMSNHDIHNAICVLTGKELPYAEHLVFISGLHMKMLGVNNVSAHDALNLYNIENTNDGFYSIQTGSNSGLGWTSYTQLWQCGVNGRSVTTGDGSSVRALYSYDTVVLTSHGALTDYVDYVSFINSH
jgi:hypothetical protein